MVLRARKGWSSFLRLVKNLFEPVVHLVFFSLRSLAPLAVKKNAWYIGNRNACKVQKGMSKKIPNRRTLRRPGEHRTINVLNSSMSASGEMVWKKMVLCALGEKLCGPCG